MTEVSLPAMPAARAGAESHTVTEIAKNSVQAACARKCVLRLMPTHWHWNSHTVGCEAPVCVDTRMCTRSPSLGKTASRWVGVPIAKTHPLKKKGTSLPPGNSSHIIHLEFSGVSPTSQCQNQNERKLFEETPFHPVMS